MVVGRLVQVPEHGEEGGARGHQEGASAPAELVRALPRGSLVEELDPRVAQAAAEVRSLRAARERRRRTLRSGRCQQDGHQRGTEEERRIPGHRPPTGRGAAAPLAADFTRHLHEQSGQL